MGTQGWKKPGARYTRLATLIGFRSDFQNLEGTVQRPANALILQMGRKARPRKVRSLAHGHRLWKLYTTAFDALEPASGH